jgi:hypothetical protein
MSESSFESFVSVGEIASVEEGGNSSSESDVPQRLVMEYRLLRDFATVDEFNNYWAEAKKGWQRKSTTTNKDGREIQSYMYVFQSPIL